MTPSHLHRRDGALKRLHREWRWRCYMRRIHGTARGWLAKRWWQVWR